MNARAIIGAPPVLAYSSVTKFVRRGDKGKIEFGEQTTDTGLTRSVKTVVLGVAASFEEAMSRNGMEPMTCSGKP